MIQQTIFYFQQKGSSHYYGRSCHTARSTFVTCPRSVGSDSRTDVNEGSNDFLCLFPVPFKKVSPVASFLFYSSHFSIGHHVGEDTIFGPAEMFSVSIVEGFPVL